MTYQRAQKRQEYAHIYLCVRLTDGASIVGDDGRVMAWTRWDDAIVEAGRRSMIVVGWFWFKEHYLPQMSPQPTAARIIQKSRRGTLFFHADLNASAFELRNLNRFDCFDFVSTSKAVQQATIERAKVWPEGLK